MTQYKGNPAILGNVVDITRAKQMEENLRKSEGDLRTLSSKLLVAQEEERKKVALELHDGIGQSLSAIKYRVETALREMEEEKSSRGNASLAPIVPMVQGAVEEVRRIQKDLRPSILDDLGILATVSWFCREFESTYPAIQIENQVDIQENDVPDPLKIVIFRISQEALNNIAKYSYANLVRFSLKHSDGRIHLSIDDDGVGFDVEEALSKEVSIRGLGLSGMRERTQFSGGTFRIESRKGEGTAIQASWQVDD
jgi:signal transduction histidine kinase